jgi:hypothetical protein
MRKLMSDPTVLRRGAFSVLSALLLLPLPSVASAQERVVVSSEITVSSREASLNLDFLDGGRLAISFEGDEVLIDGESVGDVDRGDPLDVAWRSLLGRVVSLGNGELAEALVEWSPPASLQGELASVAARLDRALEAGLQAAATPPAPPSPPSPPGVRGLGDLLSRPGLLPLLGETLEGFDLRALNVHIGEETFRISQGETLQGSLLVVDGDVEVRGTLDGDVLVVDGALRVLDGGTITGDVRLADARLFRDGGTIQGEVRTITPGEVSGAVDADRLRNELRDEIRDELRREFRRSGSSSSSPFRNIGRGISGLVENVMGLLVLSLLGWVVIHFGGARVETLAGVVRASPVRAGAVGLAATFLVLPIWILGILGLVISILGILVVPFWAVLFPMAVGVAGVVGAVAVATVLGEWVTTRRIQGLERLRSSNPFHTVLAGMALLMLSFMAANVISMAGPLTGPLHGLLTVVGTLAFVATALVGLGAVLLTRGGARAPGTPPPWAGGYDDDWDDDLFGEPGSRSRWRARWEAERARWKREEPPHSAPARDSHRREPGGAASPPQAGDPAPPRPSGGAEGRDPSRHSGAADSSPGDQGAPAPEGPPGADGFPADEGTRPGEGAPGDRPPENDTPGGAR